MTSNKKGSDIQTEPRSGSLNKEIVKVEREEQKISIAERNQLTKIIQEMNKLRKELEQIDKKEVSLPKYNINFNNEKSFLNNDVLNGINLNALNNELNANEEEDNANDINFKDNKNEEELINHKNKIDDFKNNPNKKIIEKIDFYKSRCIDIIGKKRFTRAYECIKSNKNNKKNPDSSLREKLTTILGKDNIGFWQMINQVLVLEDLLNKNTN